jgi:hypothetical protein
MKQWLVEVDETEYATNTYLVEAETEEQARRQILEGDGEGMIELRETYTENSNITNIRSVKEQRT